VGLTEAQADKVIEINYEIRMQTPRDLKDMDEADRNKKLAELKALKEKKLSEVLTPEQIKAMNAYYEDMRKNMPQKSGN
jgi:Spy/CpxP family protein refolding chaperone